MFEHLSTRSRVFWLVIASALPLLLLSVYVALDQRAGEQARARDEIEHHADLIVAMLDGTEVNRLPLPGTIRLGRGEAVVILDASGGVLARYAGRGAVRNGVSDAALDAIENAAGAAIELSDAAGVVSLFVLKKAEMNPDRGVPVRVLVNVPRAVVHEAANRALLQTLLGIAAVTLSLMACAWYGAERLVLRPIRRMLRMAAKVRTGDFAARTGMKRSREELSQLGAALDDMAEQLQARDTRLSEALADLRTQALTDILTGLYNRRYLTDVLARELLAAQRKRTVFSVVLMDIDRFKNVNDTWGHDAGDAVLKAIADLLRASIRGSDIAVRYGGEEFALLLPGTSAAIAQERAENLRRELQAQGVAYGPHVIRITASFGVAEYDGSAIDIQELMRRVDAALYAAKAAGRNTVRLHRPAGVESRALA